MAFSLGKTPMEVEASRYTCTENALAASAPTAVESTTAAVKAAAVKAATAMESAAVESATMESATMESAAMETSAMETAADHTMPSTPATAASPAAAVPVTAVPVTPTAISPIVAAPAKVVPRTGTDEQTAIEPLWSVIAIRRAGIRGIGVVSPLAFRGALRVTADVNTKRNLRTGRGRRDASEQCGQ